LRKLTQIRQEIGGKASDESEYRQYLLWINEINANWVAESPKIQLVSNYNLHQAIRTFMTENQYFDSRRFRQRLLLSCNHQLISDSPRNILIIFVHFPGGCSLEVKISNAFQVFARPLVSSRHSHV
jgi:hypothetical protein